MSTLKVDTITTISGTGNINLSRPIAGDGSNLTGVAPTKATVETLGIELPAVNLTGTIHADRYTNTVYTHPTTAGNKHIPTAGATDQVLTYSSSGTATWADPAASGATISASDPAIDTNATLGTQWVNSTSGEFFVCTDATTDDNVWTNVGAGTGNITAFPRGTQHGYVSCGNPSHTNVIQRFAFASDGNATDVGDSTQGRENGGGCSTESYGYVGGGYISASVNTIDKFAFGSSSDAADVGNLSVSRTPTGVMSTTRGYWMGGWTGATSNVIDSLVFASGGNATDWGDLTQSVSIGDVGQMSATYGYRAGGDTDGGATMQNVIDKFAFSSTANSTDVGDLVVATFDATGANSETYGYKMGGGIAPWTAHGDQIEKFAFASDGNASDVGNITVARYRVSGASSLTFGYCSGGRNPSYLDVIDKFAFASDGNSTDVGNLITATSAGVGNQQ